MCQKARYDNAIQRRIIVHKKNIKIYFISLLMLSILAGISVCQAQDFGSNKVRLLPDANGSVDVALYKSGIIELTQTAARVSVGNPGIADILLFKGSELYILAKSLGTTSVVIWNKDGDVFASWTINVTYDLDTLKLRLHELLPNEDIQVRSAQDRIFLSGSVSSVDRINNAMEIARSFLGPCVESESSAVVRDSTKGPPSTVEQGTQGQQRTQSQCKNKGKVVNLMTVSGANQVMLQIKVAEMNHDTLKKMESNFNVMKFGRPWTVGGVNGGATFPDVLTPGVGALPGPGQPYTLPIFGSTNGNNSPIGPMVDQFAPNMPSISDSGLFFSFLTGSNYFQAAIEASRQKGLTKILAEPTLTAMTGQEADFLSGGEFPIPVPQQNGAVTIQFKQFGVNVKFLPVVLDQSRINLKMNISVSDLSQSGAVTLNVPNTGTAFSIPSLTERNTSTTVELDNGQTIGISGLINNTVSEYVNKFPGLGDIPILGMLFRSQQFKSGKTELVMFVTPHLAKPIASKDVQLPTDSFVPPGDLSFYLLGQMESLFKPKNHEAKSEKSAPLTGSSIPMTDSMANRFGQGI